MTRLRIVMHRIEGALATRLNEFQASDIPLLASPQGGVAARVRKCREASSARADGVVFRMVNNKENHPGCVCFGGFAKFFLMSQPPLLAVMQGGEYRSPVTHVEASQRVIPSFCNTPSL